MLPTNNKTKTPQNSLQTIQKLFLQKKKETKNPRISSEEETKRVRRGGEEGHETEPGPNPVETRGSFVRDRRAYDRFERVSEAREWRVVPSGTASAD